MNVYICTVTSQICGLVASGQVTRVLDPEELVPYAYNTNTRFWVGYDDIASVSSKVGTFTCTKAACTKLDARLKYILLLLVYNRLCTVPYPFRICNIQ